MNNDVRVLLVEDHECQATVLRKWLEHLLGLDVVTADNAEAARQALAQQSFDLIVTDISMPGEDGLSMVESLRDWPNRPRVIITTAAVRTDYAIRALELKVEAFIAKPVRPQQIREKIAPVIESIRHERAVAKQNHRTVLAIGAHPDDVEIGVGGALLRHVDRGDRVVILTLSGGEAGGAVSTRAVEAKRAAELLGAELRLGSLPDTYMSSGRDTIEAISQVVREIEPQVIYTHSIADAHQDHRAVHEATVVAARSVDNLFTYQAPSTTTLFVPNTYADIGETIDRKLELIRIYESQTQKAPYLESELLRATARYWGRFAGYRYVEPMIALRTLDSTIPLNASTQERTGWTPAPPVIAESDRSAGELLTLAGRR